MLDEHGNGFFYVLVGVFGKALTHFRWDVICRMIFMFLSGGRSQRRISGNVFEFDGRARKCV